MQFGRHLESLEKKTDSLGVVFIIVVAGVFHVVVDVLDSPLQYIVLKEQHIHPFPKESYFLSLLKSIYDAALGQNLT